MVVCRHRGRDLSSADILYIRELIAAHPEASRRSLSRLLCEAWEWRQPNGAPRDMVCRSMLLLLDRAGQITLPPVSYVRHNPLVSRRKPAPVLIDRSPIETPLRELRPLEFMQVRRTGEEVLFNSLMEELALPGQARLGISHLVITSLAGTPKRGEATYVSSPITPDS
jgi:hypothetical protein